MARNHNPVQQLKEAKQFARDYGMFIVEKPDGYLLYRKCEPKNIYLGKRTTISALRRHVEACAYHPRKAETPAERRAVMQ